MRTFLIPPNNTSYTVDKGTTNLEVQLDGGLSRRRKDVLGAAKIVAVEWIFNRSQYLYFNAFYDTECCEGAHPFNLELIVDTPLLVLRKVWFVSDSVKTTEQKGLMYKVVARLEVEPLPIDDEFNEDYLDAFETDPEQAWELYLESLEP